MFLIYPLAFIVAIAIIVFIHELGHFLVARFFSVKIDAFSLGFGKTLYSWKDRQGTDWKICLLPIGGYVKFAGDANVASQPSTEEMQFSPDHFHTKPIWQKALVVAAGPVANFLLSIFIFAASFAFVGVPDYDTRIASLQPNSAAVQAGLREGDYIRRIDGVQMNRFTDILGYVTVRPDEEMMLSVERESSLMEIKIKAGSVEEDDRRGGKVKIGRLGFSRDKNAPLIFEKLDPIDAISEGVWQTWGIIANTLRFLKRVFTGEISYKTIGGAATMAQVLGEAASSGLTDFIVRIALISTSIGLVNLFPIPLLDGGHLVFYAIEALRGKPLGAKGQEWAFRIGVSLVLFLMLFSNTNDIFEFIRCGTKFGQEVC